MKRLGNRSLRLGTVICTSVFILTAGFIFLSWPAAATPLLRRWATEPITRPELVLQTGHTLKINCLVFGPNGQWLASGGADNSIKIWDVASGRELRALTGHTGWVNALAVSRDGRLLASGSNDLMVHVWDVQTGQQLHILRGHSGAILSLAFSADGKLLASGGADNSIRIWELSTEREQQTLRGHTGLVSTLVFSPDGKFLASGSADNAVKLWNTSSWRENSHLQKHTGRITAIAFSADGKSVYSAGADGLLFAWQVDSVKPRFVSKHDGAMVAVFSGEGGGLKTAGDDGSIVDWDAIKGKEKASRTSTENEFGTNSLTAAIFNPDGSILAASSGNRTVSLLSANTAKSIRTLESRSTGFYAVGVSGDGKWLASGANDRSVRLWQTSTGRELPRLTGSTGWITSISFSDDSRLIAAASISGEVKVWDLRTGHESFKLTTDHSSINSVVFSKDKKWLAAAGVQGTIQLWDLSARTSRRLSGHTAEITSLSFSPEENLLASAGSDKTIRLWDPVTGNNLKTLATLSDQVNAIAFSPDGKSLVAGGADKKVALFEIPSGRLLKTLGGHAGEVLSLSFSPDGRTILSGSSDHTARLWDVDSGKELRIVARSSGNIDSLGFGPGGEWVFAGDDDGSISIANSGTGELMVTLVSMRDSDDWLVVTPDGLFDGSPSSWGLLLWRFAGNTFNVSPVESFFNEFYYPGLLAELLAGRNPKPARDITQKDRRQPQVKLAVAVDSSTPIDKRSVTLRITVSESPPDREHQQASGARDLRLFRNGLLVKLWSGDILENKGERTLEAFVPVIAGENNFTAYAFNRENVKSSDVSLSLRGADSLKRVGTAYVLAIGVGHYENPQYNLNYSVADAQAIGEQWKQQQESLGQYKPVVVIPLLNEEATKANILLAMQRLAGTDTGPLSPGSAPVLAAIHAAQPEDAVLVYFSGHGTAQGDRFYLIPHDLGYHGSRTELDQAGLQTIITHSISDIELEEAFKPLDAEQLLLVIDACNSGQALEAEEKRRGPMNTRGLAQLAYEKGMYVLTASQSVEVAFESEALKHSYLAYALVEEGIKSGAADADGDGRVVLDEWFDYAMERVPRMGKDKSAGGKELIEVDPDERRVQRPRAFYAARAGNQQLVVARLHAAGTQ